MRIIINYTLDGVDYKLEGEFETFEMQEDRHYNCVGENDYTTQTINVQLRPNPTIRTA